MVAASDPGVAFVVMMAGDGVPGDQLIVEQTRLLAEAAGASKEKAAENAGQEREVLALVESEKDAAALDKKLREKLAADGMPEAQIGPSIRALTSPWFRYLLTYDPRRLCARSPARCWPSTARSTCKFRPRRNLPPIRKALEDGGNKHYEVDELPGLNHLFQTAKTGSLREYGEIEETMSPVALDKMASWILKQ